MLSYRKNIFASIHKRGVFRHVALCPLVCLRFNSCGLNRGFGFLRFGRRVFFCVIGYAGVSSSKKEGDKKTPRGSFAVITSLYRADRIKIPASNAITIKNRDVWCDDSKHKDYNKMIRIGFNDSRNFSYEKIHRRDHLYDIVLVIAYNQFPVVSGLGSAIFIHMCHVAHRPTLGCLALRRNDMFFLARKLPRNAFVRTV